MAAEIPTTQYPGDDATPRQLLELADQYRKASQLLLSLSQPRKPLSRAPYGLNAIHAVELYLNAFLVATGEPCGKVRGLHHNLDARTKFALSKGLVLKKRTAAHLRQVSNSREYVVSRYDPKMTGASQLTRIEATLNDVADKVSAHLAKSKRA